MLRVLARSVATLALASSLAHAAEPAAEGRDAAALQRPALTAARPAQAVLLTVARAGKRLVAAGERGLVIVSNDDGRSWTQATVPVSVTLTGLRFANDKEGWAIGNMGVVLRTQDGGSTWQRALDGRAAAQVALSAARAAFQAPGPGAGSSDATVALEDAQRLVAEGADKPFLDIALRPDGSVLVVGAYGLAFASKDGGKTWQAQMQSLPNPDGLSYYGIAERRGETFLFGEQGLLLRSAKAGEAFTTEVSPSTGTLFGAVAQRDGSLLLMGLRGKAWRSAEPGAPWALVQTPVDASLFAGAQLSDGTTVMVGAAGQVLISNDNGQKFRVAPIRVRFPFTGLAETADGALLLVGMRGVQRLESPELKASAESIRDARTPDEARLTLKNPNPRNAS